MQHCAIQQSRDPLQIKKVKILSQTQGTEQSHRNTSVHFFPLTIPFLSLQSSDAGYLLNCVCLLVSILSELKHRNFKMKIKFLWWLQAQLLLMKVPSYLCQVTCFSPSGLVLSTMCGCAEHFVPATISLSLYLKGSHNLSLHISATPNNSWGTITGTTGEKLFR